MTWRPTTKLRWWVVVVAAGLVVSLLSRRPEAVVLVTPIAFALTLALLRTNALRLSVDVALDRRKVTEGDTVRTTVVITSAGPVPQLDVFLALPDELSAAEATDPGRGDVVGVTLRRGERRPITLEVRADRWGTHTLGPLDLRARGPLGMMAAEGRVSIADKLVVYPRPEALRRLVRAAVVQTTAGSQLARTKGAGIEFADIRAFAPGDRVREINWRVTARRGGLWVNQRHPDRSTDVVIFLDTFSGAALDVAVRAATTLATAYLDRRDRVGLVSFGGTLRWLRPGMGLRQAYVVVDTLMASRVFPSVAWKDIDLLPPRVLPPRALVVAISPLEDPRALRALVDLRSRGIDLVIIELSPTASVQPIEGRAGELAYRLWKLQRAAVRDRYRSLGVPTVEWQDGRALSEAVEELGLWPRQRMSRV
ncbi:MAG TPA: DUF58 domain-containing protein [Acidimicrobiales bacterium]|nr:DUF58 domain-containing protein [Acidimicrobiales bacterium]